MMKMATRPMAPVPAITITWRMMEPVTNFAAAGGICIPFAGREYSRFAENATQGRAIGLVASVCDARSDYASQ
ncbi:hypothetical protein GCM10011491_08590 [Brucella endophytica]|uniref:Uncharacterized protein n=1 Tax=Brucella endophytica TaxID=1963359 RepID=A0A916S655_9HYPH|nr:hypothetical protein GCM10011491_08590 [Brucella endophytica]